MNVAEPAHHHSKIDLEGSENEKKYLKFKNNQTSNLEKIESNEANNQTGRRFTFMNIGIYVLSMSENEYLKCIMKYQTTYFKSGSKFSDISYI